MTKILIDADTGIDDSVAILFALKRRDIKVVGITTGCGNTSARQAAENTIRLIRLAGVDYKIPVSVGADAPLNGVWDGPVTSVHGQNGIGDVELATSAQKLAEESAPEFIARMARENAGELVIVALGRLTNLALALQLEPELPRLVSQVVAMGGTLHVPGNVSPVTEANFGGDPEAADQVLCAGFQIVLVGLDVTTKTRLHRQQIEILAKHCPSKNREIVSYLQKALDKYWNYYRFQSFNLDHCPVHDPLAMLVAIDPGLVKIRKLRARVECGGTYCRGMVVTDLREHPFDAPFSGFCTDVDGERAVEELLSAFMN